MVGLRPHPHFVYMKGIKIMENFENLKIYVKLKTYAFESIFAYEYTVRIWNGHKALLDSRKSFNILGTEILLSEIKDNLKIFDINKDNVLSVAAIYHESFKVDWMHRGNIHIPEREEENQLNWAYCWISNDRYKIFDDIDDLYHCMFKDIQNPYNRLLYILGELNCHGGYICIDDNTKGFHLTTKSKDDFYKWHDKGNPYDLNDLPNTFTFMRKKNIHDKNTRIVTVETKDIFNKFSPLVWTNDVDNNYKVGQPVFVNVKETETFIIRGISGNVRKSYILTLDGVLSPILIKVSEKRLNAFFVTDVGKRDKKNDIPWAKFLIKNGCEFKFEFTYNNLDVNTPYCIKGDTINFSACFISANTDSTNWRLPLTEPTAPYRHSGPTATEYFMDHCEIYPWNPPKIK